MWRHSKRSIAAQRRDSRAGLSTALHLDNCVFVIAADIQTRQAQVSFGASVFKLGDVTTDARAPILTDATRADLGHKHIVFVSLNGDLMGSFIYHRPLASETKRGFVRQPFG